MTFPKARLVVSACLFAAWIGFLIYLVAHRPGTAISKPQFLIASLYVVAEVKEDQGRPSADVSIEKVLWAADSADRKLVGQPVVLPGLPMCQKTHGFRGAGKYLLPLMKLQDADTAYLIAPLPYIREYNQAEPSLATVELEHVGWDATAWPGVAASTVGLAASPSVPAPLLASSVRFSAWGLNREKVLGILVDLGRRKRAESEAMLASAESYHTVVVARRWPAPQAEKLAWKLKTAGAAVKINPEEIRIYAWTPAIQSQVEEIIAAKK